MRWLAIAFVCGCSGSSSQRMPPDLGGDSGSPPTGGAVLMHHNHPSRDGLYVVPALTRQAAMGAAAGFSAATMGHTYAQPLYLDGTLYVATEENRVYALDAASGDVKHEVQLGPPVKLSDLPCGNIDPLGITGTPVIDEASSTLYVDVMTTPDGGSTKQHLVYALALADLSTKSGWPVDVGAAASSGGVTFDPTVQNQRGALALVGGRLYVPYGGHYGDCGDYHGWLVGISAADPGDVKAWATPARGGGSWAPSGVASDGSALYLTTGNTFGASTWMGGEAIVRFSAGPVFSGQARDYFSPTNWMDLDAGDIDIGGTGPILFDLPGAHPSQLVVALGKDGNAYLVDRSNLGGVSNAAATKAVSGGEIINAAVAYPTPSGTFVVFMGTGMGCPGGRSGSLTALKIGAGSPPSIDVAWCAGGYGLGSPMVTTTDGTHESVVWWVASEGDNQLHAFDGESGQELAAPGGIGSARRYITPIAADGRIYVAADDALYAFSY